ncbi:MAG: SUMF1/EgtB/PvdO family nonheme iron enzyme [Pseudomonadota bacterium]
MDQDTAFLSPAAVLGKKAAKAAKAARFAIGLCLCWGLQTACSHDEEFGECKVRCAGHGQCPSGMSCRSDDYCHRGKPADEFNACGAIDALSTKVDAIDASVMGGDAIAGDAAPPDASTDASTDASPDASADASAGTSDTSLIDVDSGGVDALRTDAATVPVDAGTMDLGPCSPTTCARAKKDCGTISDGCGGLLNCGSCSSPDTCGGSGEANKCGCRAKSCAGLGAACGTLSDGCRGTLNCGWCEAPQTCGGGGTSYQCGCTPVTCQARGAKCGTISDGCGGTLNCGSCMSPETCGGSGIPNVCGETGGSFPSCVGLAATCGPAGTGDCCETLLVPGGTYDRGNNPDYPATVSDFMLDRYEITVGRFRKFVEAGMGTHANPPIAGSGAHPLIEGSGWDSAWDTRLPADTAALKTAVRCDSTYQTWTDTAGANESLPMNCLDWYDAFAFCAWDGGRVPTEAEWNYAAAGGNEQREYPWGSTTPDGTYAVYDCLGDGSAADTCAFSDVLVVGSRSSKGDGRWGQTDLAGSMWEWTLDWYNSTYPTPCVDCANLALASYRSIRGGGFVNFADSLASSYRYVITPSSRYFNYGGRCARTP